MRGVGGKGARKRKQEKAGREADGQHFNCREGSFQTERRTLSIIQMILPAVHSLRSLRLQKV